jgi:ornithine cyclodeaminase/alanine dehydrogenase-like protein (mu-crystallin family)
MALYLTENDVDRLLEMPACIAAVEHAFQDVAMGNAAFRPRARVAAAGAMLHVLPAASDRLGRLAVKAYATTSEAAHFVVLLFDTRTAEHLATIEANRLGQRRTGAASGVATKYLARADAAILAVLGTGWQARAQVEAIGSVRRLREVRVWGRDRDRLIEFCGDVARATGVSVQPAANPEKAVRDADIVVTATSAGQPILKGAWLSPGMHLNVVGSNRADRREIDDEAVARADVIVVDSSEQARLEAGDLLLAKSPEGSLQAVTRAIDLATIVSGRHPGRTDARTLTLFKSLGIGLEDLAAASLVYDRARAAGAGRPCP